MLVGIVPLEQADLFAPCRLPPVGRFLFFCLVSEHTHIPHLVAQREEIMLLEL